MDDHLILQMENISKSFPGVNALSNVNLAVRHGTIHALMGENGAGKSTLMKILDGMYLPDRGHIIFHGQTVTVDSPRTETGNFNDSPGAFADPLHECS